MTICNCAACIRPGMLVNTSGCWPMRSDTSCFWSVVRSGPSVNPVSASRRVVKECFSRTRSSSLAGFCNVENSSYWRMPHLHHVDVCGAGLLPLIRHPDRVC